jgi:hypothetical protein
MPPAKSGTATKASGTAMLVRPKPDAAEKAAPAKQGPAKPAAAKPTTVQKPTTKKPTDK